MENPFVLPKDAYRRNLDLLKGYFDQNVHFLHRMTDQPKDKCLNFLKRTLSRGGEFPIQDPNMLVLQQESPGNRIQTEMTFLSYIRTVTDTDRILSPSLVCYENPEVLKSPSAKFVEKGIADRKVAKKAAFKAKVAKDFVLEKIKDAEQNAKKIGINSLSGMHGFTGNILYVKSGHSSLTSMCRSATSYGNAGNEKLLAGSRHYWSPQITLSNIMALITSQPHDEFERAMTEYNMVYPTVEQTASCIRRSTDLYWRNSGQFQKIVDLIVKLTPLERAIVVYTGDLYHIAQYNDELVRGWMDKMIKYDPDQDLSAEPIQDPYALLTSGRIDDDTRVLAIYLNAADTKDEDLDSLKEKGREDVLLKVAKTALNVLKVSQSYFTFIRTFLTPVLLAPSAANIKGILRRVVLASDTDSTIFTTQEWVSWYTGSDARTKEGDGIWYTITYVACQCIIHVLAQLSTNMGVVKPDLHRLTMKNEYAFPVFTLTSRAKHYYAQRSCREGNVFAKYDMEIKGVALRSSTVPPTIIRAAKEFMREVMERADANRQFTLEEVYQTVWRYEQDIYTSIKKGEHKYLKSAQIQESYANMNKENPYQEKTNYKHYLMWQEVFAPKYGQVEHPPYSVIKVPLAIGNKTDMQTWLTKVEAIDPEFAERLRHYCKMTGRDQIAVLMLPLSILSGIGMPDEVMCMIDIRRLTYEILESFYMIVESLGVFQVDSKYVRLISDIYTPSGEVNLQPVPTDANSLLNNEEDLLEDDSDEEDWLVM